LLHRSTGDSRADALVDLLAKIWTDAPDERVLVAAQDNLTVDYLFGLVQSRLPEIGPLGARVRLVAARVRQGMETEAVEDLGGFGNETSENLEAFQRGDAQVLFAPEAAQCPSSNDLRLIGGLCNGVSGPSGFKVMLRFVDASSGVAGWSCA
jgi:hypothetical protein